MAGDEVSLLIGEYRKMFGEELREAMKKSKQRESKIAKKSPFERSSTMPDKLMPSSVKRSTSPGKKKKVRLSPQRDVENLTLDELKLQLQEANLERAALQSQIVHLQGVNLDAGRVFRASLQTICSSEERIRENIEWCMHEERTSLSTMLAATSRIGFDHGQLARMRSTNERLQQNLYKVEQYDAEVRHRTDAERSIAVLQQSLLEKEIIILKQNPKTSDVDTQTEESPPEPPASVSYEKIHLDTSRRFITRLLKGVYSRHDPKMVPKCTDEAKLWVGKEEDLFRVLSNAYGLKVGDFAKIMKKQELSPSRERSASSASKHPKPVASPAKQRSSSTSRHVKPSTSAKRSSSVRASTPTRPRRSRSVDVFIGTPVRPSKHFSSSRASSPSKLIRPPKPSLIRITPLANAVDKREVARPGRSPMIVDK
eukprot:TRINITY_DN1012_c5_g1_i1.p1 TRINITY_DN1012_c5_g1~~TRINITY_DN1012_c5_g1_i1.p1  ORF type:complete len:447 (+),score=82.64 TRINITY_DN1012_c5_g1_i1:65-1342(+)